MKDHQQHNSNLGNATRAATPLCLALILALTTLSFGRVASERRGPPSPEASPTADANPTAEPSPTAVPFSNVTYGYYSSTSNGVGIPYFVDPSPDEGTQSYRIQLFRTDNPSVIVGNFIYNVPPGQAGSIHGTNDLVLPLVNPEVATSWENHLQMKVLAYSGNDAGGTRVFTSGLFYCQHPSADVQTLSLQAPPASAGANNFNLTDNRATAKIGCYRYDVMGAPAGFGPLLQFGQTDHGIGGNFGPDYVHGLVTRTVSLNVASGTQFFHVRVRREYRNSAGTSLGRFAVGAQSGALAVTAP